MLIGMLVAQDKLSVSPGIFLGKLAEMVEPGDAAGLIGKGPSSRWCRPCSPATRACGPAMILARCPGRYSGPSAWPCW